MTRELVVARFSREVRALGNPLFSKEQKPVLQTVQGGFIAAMKGFAQVSGFPSDNQLVMLMEIRPANWPGAD